MCGGLLSVVMVLLDIICSLKKEIFFQPVLISLSFLLYFLSFLFLIGCVRKKQLQYIENLFLLMVCLSVMENVNWWKWNLNLVLCSHCRPPLISAGKRVYHLLQSFGTTFFYFFWAVLFNTFSYWEMIKNPKWLWNYVSNVPNVVLSADIDAACSCCSIFSRYGIHSLPSIFLVNQTSRLQYQGPKDLHSLVQFYEKTTGKGLFLSAKNCFSWVLLVSFDFYL